MPCDQIRLNTLDIKASNRALMIQALAGLGLQVVRATETTVRFLVDGVWSNVDFKAGKITLPAGREDLADQIKRRYALEAVKQASRQYGWKLTWSNQAKTKLTATRGY